MLTSSTFAPCAAAASSPAIRPRYSAALLVTVPRYSPRASTSRPDSSLSTNPNAPGPGFPRAPPSQRSRQTPGEGVSITRLYPARASAHKAPRSNALQPARPLESLPGVGLTARHQFGGLIGREPQHAA